MAGLAQARSEPRRQVPPPVRQGSSSPRKDSAATLSGDRRSAEQTLAQQRTAGNQAVAADIERRWTLTIGGEKLENLTPSQTLEALGRHYRRVNASIAGGFEGHKYLMELQRDQPFAAYVSETLGGVDMPDIGIWDKAQNAAFAAHKAIKSGAIDAAVAQVSIAVDEYDKAYRIFVKYRDGTEAGADRAITGLKVTAAAGAVAATIATGGAASAAGAGLLGTSAVVGTTAGVYGASQEFAGQASEVYIAETRKSFDVGAILKRGATDAVIGFVGSIAGGVLAKQFAKMFGSYLSKANIADDVLKEMGEALGMKGPLPRDFFLTGGQRFIADFLSGIGTTPLTTAVSIAVNQFTGQSKIPSMSEFLQTVLEEMATGGALQIFIGLITRGKAHGPASKGKGSKKGGTPPKSRKAPAPDVELSGKPAANDNVELPGPTPEPTSSAAKPEYEPLTAANDNVEMASAASEQMAPMKMAAGAEGMSQQPATQASRGGSKKSGSSQPPASVRGSRTASSASASPTPKAAATKRARAADKRGNQPISAKEAKAAQEKKAAVESKKSAEQQELQSVASKSSETNRQVSEATQQPLNRPPELDAEFRKLPPIEEPDLRLEAINELRERGNWSPEGQEYLDKLARVLEGRAQQQANKTGATKAGENIQKIDIADLPDAVTRLREASRSVKNRMRKKGDNYKEKMKSTRDEVFDKVDAEGWPAYAKKTTKKLTFQPDHLDALDRIANRPEMLDFYTVYEAAPETTQKEMVKALEAIGDRPDNLVSMQGPANAAKGNRSWYAIDPAAFAKYGYEMKHILKMRKLEDESLDRILKAIKQIANDFRGK